MPVVRAAARALFDPRSGRGEAALVGHLVRETSELRRSKRLAEPRAHLRRPEPLALGDAYADRK